MITNLVRRLKFGCTRDSSIYLTLLEGPLRYRKQLFHNGYNNCKRNFNQNKSTFKSKSVITSPFAFGQVKFPGFLTLSMLGCLALNYEYFKSKLLEIIPKVQGLSMKDLTGRRRQFNFIAAVAELAAPAVVYIEIRDTKKFDYYSGQPTPISNGSGFIIEPDGLIVTNAHVVIDNALRSNISVMVKLLDGRTFEGKVENVDRISDLATVRIKCNNLPTLRLGSSSTLKAGEWVVALGSPLALSNTVTCGIISAYRKSEELGLHRQKMVYLQTDAAINQGNSGGPLMNLNGEVIGINSMKILPGISFAIPMDHAKKFLRGNQDKRFQQKALRTRYIGITMLTLDESLIIELRRRKCSLSENVREGVLIWKVIPDSPAASQRILNQRSTSLSGSIIMIVIRTRLTFLVDSIGDWIVLKHFMSYTHVSLKPFVRFFPFGLSFVTCPIQDYEPFKTKVKHLFPEVRGDGLTEKDLPGRRKESGFVAYVAEILHLLLLYWC